MDSLSTSVFLGETDVTPSNFPSEKPLAWSRSRPMSTASLSKTVYLHRCRLLLIFPAASASASSLSVSGHKWVSSSASSWAKSPLQKLLTDRLPTLPFPRADRREDKEDVDGYDRELTVVSILKSCAYDKAIFVGQQVHALVLKSGLGSNSYVKNSLINLYAKCGSMAAAESLFGASQAILDPVSCNIMIAGYAKLGRLAEAHELFEKMPGKGCVSYATVIMGFSQNNCGAEAVRVFKDMRAAGLVPCELTVASLISACAQLVGGILACRMLHGLSIKLVIDTFVAVSTNLLNMYCLCSSLGDARKLFSRMPERNVVSWNVMLNGYAKAGLVRLAEELFDDFPAKDMISWATMISGYTRAGLLREGLMTCRKMLQIHLRPDDVILVELISVCARSTALVEGQQLHGMVIKSGFDSYDFMQATIIHFYASCNLMDLAHLQLNIGIRDHLPSINALIAGFARNGMIDGARKLFEDMSRRDVFSWSTMISCYDQHEQPATALDLFHRMIASGSRPNEVTMTSVFSAIASLGLLSEGRRAHEYVVNYAIPMSSNLSASMINMYAKCGSIDSAVELFYQVRDVASHVSPWNAIICGLAVHGHGRLSLELFHDLQRREIKLNSITFMGVLTACCHSGFVEEGERYFKSMKSVYGVEPKVGHYGCMVDMLGRAGRVKEAEELIRGMPMKADVAVWGALLAACQTHGYVELGEIAARNVAELEPSHGPCQVMLSNIYAGTGRWNDAFLARRVLAIRRLERSPGSSGIT